MQISGGGNDCLFEGNHLHDLCYEATDSGALYVGRSWSQRGNAVRGNLFERVRPTEQVSPSATRNSVPLSVRPFHCSLR